MEVVHVLDLIVAQSDLAGSKVVLLFFPCFGIHLHSSKSVICRSAFVVRRPDESRRLPGQCLIVSCTLISDLLPKTNK